MKTLTDLGVYGQSVLVRVDFNVLPFKAHELRIEETLPTLEYLLRRRAKVFLLTHLETNDGKIPSNLVLWEYLRKRYFPRLKFEEKILAPGEISLLENLRKNPGEKKADKNFAKKLAALGELYVNEAFSVSHRRHASIVLLPRLLDAGCGFLFEREIKNLSRVFKPPHPFTLILGGGKVETKLPLLKSLLPRLDFVLLGGVLLNIYVFQKKPLPSRKIILPREILHSGPRALDVGGASFPEWEKVIRKSKLVVWNGPLGHIEKGFTSGTKRLVSILRKTKGEVLIGGGDTLDFLPRKLPRNIFVSTAGGAMLDYLIHKTLPGLEALKK